MSGSVTREQLYAEVWAEPMTKVAARYGVSSSYLARVCERLNVPRPARGYWAQLEVGKVVPRPSLPDARPGDELEWSRDGEPRRARRALPEPPAQHQTPPHRTPSRRTRHELLVGAREHFDAAKESHHGYLRPSKRRLVDVFVSRAALDRALRSANALFVALENGGHRVTLASPDQNLRRLPVDERSKGRRDHEEYGSWRPDRATVVYIGTVAIGLTIFELSEEIEVQYHDGKYIPVAQVRPATRRGFLQNGWSHRRDMPSGKLCLRASSPYAVAEWERHWREAKKGELVSKIPEIVRALEIDAVTVAGLVAEGEQRLEAQRREWEAEQERWRREEAEKRRLRAIEESTEELLGIVNDWAVAKRIEEFFADAGQRATRLSDEERATLVERLDRARSLLGGTDALQRFLAWKTPNER